MPLSPEISLQGRGVDIKPFDPVSTLVQVAQLKNLQTQEQMRQLQMAQLGNQLGEYQRVQGVLANGRGVGQGSGGPAPGMVSGAQLGNLPSPGFPGPGSPSAPGGPPAIAPLYNQLSPATQAAYPNGPPPDAGQMPPGVMGASPTPQGAPQSAPGTPQEQSGPTIFPSTAAMEARIQLHKALFEAGPTLGRDTAMKMAQL